MAAIVVLLERVLSTILTILGIEQIIRGRVAKAAQEHSDFAIENAAFAAHSELTSNAHGLAAIKAHIEEIQTPELLSLQDVIDAMPEVVPFELPEDPPEGYGGSTPAQVWQHTQAAWLWGSNPDSWEMQQHLKDVRSWTEAQFLGLGIVWPDCPDFAYCLWGGFAFQAEMSVDGDLHDAKPSGVDWTDWNGTETIVAFLNRVKPALTWSYTNIKGVSTPGWAWGYDGVNSPAGYWRCLVSDADLPTKSTRIGGIQTTLGNQQALSIALGLASLFAVGAGDIGTLVTLVGTLLGQSGDIEAALTSLFAWLTNRSQGTNQEQSTQLVTVGNYVDTLETALQTDTDTITGDIAQAVLDLAANVLAVRGTNEPTIAEVRSDLSTIRGDSSTTLASLDAKLDDILDALAGAGGGPPSWPGLANVTLGDPVAITANMSLAGPIDGALYEVTGAPGTLGRAVVGGHTTWLRLGQAAFVSDNGDMDAFQSVNWDNGILVPRYVLTPASLVLHFVGGVSGTVTPWLRDTP